MALRSLRERVVGSALGGIFACSLACGGDPRAGADAWADTDTGTDDGATAAADTTSGEATASAADDDSDPSPPSGSTSGDPDPTTTDGPDDDSGGSTGGVPTDCPRVRVQVAPGASLNVRPSPSTAEEPVGSLVNGEIVDVLDQVMGELVEGSDVWFQIASADLEGFVSASHTSCTLDECVLLEVPDAEYLTYGLHPDASDALQYLGVSEGSITQTIGDAAASAGTHASDGTAEGHDYTCAIDLSVSGLSEDEIHQYIDDLAAVGYAGWYRQPGADGVPSSWAPHIHAVWAGAPMKASLRDQVRSWIDGRNGLVSDTPYAFHQWPQCLRDAIWERYLQHNPADG